RPPELSVSAPAPADTQPFAGPLPSVPELSDIPSSSRAVPHPAGVPTSVGELADPVALPPRTIALSSLSLPSPVELAEITPSKVEPSLVRMPIPGGAELALAAREPQPPVLLPPLAALPEFGRVALRYRPPAGGATADATLPAAVRPAFELILDSSGSMSDKVQGEA